MAIGFFPPIFFVSLTFAVLFFLVSSDDGARIWKRVGCTAAILISYAIFGYLASKTYYTTMWQIASVTAAIAVAFTVLTLFFLRNVPREKLKKLSIFLIFASIVSVVSSALTVHVLKYLWGRPRYRELIAAGDTLLEGFTPWYQCNGFSLHGHHSFPSGHTCAATNLLVLLALEEVYPEKADKKRTILLVVGMYIFIMAYSRIVMGAHFLSDVTAGFAIGFVTYVVARYVYFEKSRAVLSAITEEDAAAETAEIEEIPEIAEEAETPADEQAESEGGEPSREEVPKAERKEGEE